MKSKLFKFLRELKLKYNRIRVDSKFSLSKFISNDFGFSRGTPIDRYYIEKFIEKNRNYISGNVLEFGDNYYYKKYANSKNSRCDIFTSELEFKTGRKDKIYGDLTKVNPENFTQYDCIICTNVLNFIFDIDSATIGITKLLKPNGICILTLAGYSTHISKYDYDRWGDYWRFTDKSAELLFNNYLEIVDKNLYGNYFAASAQINGYSLEDIDPSMANLFCKEYLMTIGLVLKKGDIFCPTVT
jgi:hypothetical protein